MAGLDALDCWPYLPQRVRGGNVQRPAFMGVGSSDTIFPGDGLREQHMNVRRWLRSRKVRSAFTMIELLVVIAIIGVLAALLVGGLAAAQFRSRVTSCSNNFRQWGIAVNLYAAEDPSGRLPAYAMRVSEFNGYGDLLPWMVSREMGTNLGRYGVTVPLWFCPARPEKLQIVRDNMNGIRPGWTLNSMEDLTAYWEWETGKGLHGRPRSFAVINYNWLVPRPLVDSGNIYPDPKVNRSRIPDGWPRKLEYTAGAVQPIMTDQTFGGWNEDKTSLQGFAGGHQFPQYSMRNINVLFVDGHVETRSAGKLQWQFEAQGSMPIQIVY